MDYTLVSLSDPGFLVSISVLGADNQAVLVCSGGVFQDALYADGLAPAATLSWIGSTQSSAEAIFAIPCARLAAAYGPRKISIAGSIFAGLGPILAGFCTKSVGGLIVTEVSEGD